MQLVNKIVYCLGPVTVASVLFTSKFFKMPGNSRPFREDPSSYERTGVPRGNPTRYQSHGVVRMCHDGTPYKDQRAVVPVEDIETEADRQLKALLHKQLDTQVSLNQAKGQKKRFIVSSSYKPLGEEVAGIVTLQQYATCSTRESRVQELRAFGLTSDEVRLKMKVEESSDDIPPTKKRHIGPAPGVFESRLDDIDRTIQDKSDELAKPDVFSGVKVMSRHEMDLERAITADRGTTKMQKCLMVTEGDPGAGTKDLSHPMYHLDSILEEALQKRRREAQEAETAEADRKQSVATCLTRDEALSRRDQTSAPQHEQSETLVTCSCLETRRAGGTAIPSYCHSCHRLNKESRPPSPVTCITNQDSHPNLSESPSICSKSAERNSEGKVKFNGPVESIPVDVIEKYRLTLDQVREIPRFKDYHPGEPCETLYLKNLGSKVTEEDLVSLFIRFQQPDQPKIVFRLLTGRMRGQAFVTFHAEDVAAEALRLVNGYNFKGKPIIIQFGKKTTSAKPS